MELSTNYMGLELRTPLVASASPLSHTVDGVRRLADAGVGAVVLHSLFEEEGRGEGGVGARGAGAGSPPLESARWCCTRCSRSRCGRRPSWTPGWPTPAPRALPNRCPISRKWPRRTTARAAI